MVSDTLTNKRVVIFAGHYGSGKTNVASNYSFMIREKGYDVTIADLDIVNPYFRSKDAQSFFVQNGVNLISSEYAGSNVDLPALPPEAYSLFETKDKNKKAVVDLGGDDRGAYAMGRYRDLIKEENDYAMLYVFNHFRPLTKDTQEAIEIMREIEEASKIKFTGIVNNSNLGDMTTKEDVLSSVKYADELAEKTNIPVVITSIKANVAKDLIGEVVHLLPMNIYVKQSWSKEI